MNEENPVWIDPSAARRLMLEYQRLLRVRGASKIVRLIKDHTSFDLDRKTLENFLDDRGIEPSYVTLKAIARFLATRHFAEAVPRVRDYLDSEARLHRIGAALFDLHGAVGEDLPTALDRNRVLGGWWWNRGYHRGYSKDPNYLYITPVPEHPFSKIQVLVNCKDVPEGSGIVFVSLKGAFHFSAHIWSQTERYREKVVTLLLFPFQAQGDDELSLMFESSDQQIEQVKFRRIEEAAVPSIVRAQFEEWDRNILPRNADERSLASGID